MIDEPLAGILPSILVPRNRKYRDLHGLALSISPFLAVNDEVVC
jgi:hypothetical protein